jgi:hypothetical protein
MVTPPVPKTYPRLLVTLRRVPVMVKVGAGHRTMDIRRCWTVVYLLAQGDEHVHFIGRDASIWGWSECIDFARAVVAKAGAGS